MKYEDFVCFVQTGVMNLLGEDVVVELHHVKKNNDVELEGLSFCTKESNIAPTIYLNHFYDEYNRGTSIPEIVENIRQTYESTKVNASIDVREYTDYEQVKDKLACKLINREKNRDFLKEVPHLTFLNLAIIVYYRVDHELLGSGCITVHKSHLDMWNISEEQLLYEARKNTRRILPERFMNISKILMLDPQYTDVEDLAIPMYVLTNEDSCFGACCIIYDGILKEIGEVLQDDFWIIPSSIHECIILPMHEDITADEIASMVSHVNTENVAEEEYLSDDVYYYQRDLHKIMIAKTNPTV